MADEASALIDTNFGGTGKTLNYMRGGWQAAPGGGCYATTPVGDTIGYQFSAAKPIDTIKFYNYAAAGRIKTFKIQRYDGGSWTDVVVTGVGANMTLTASDNILYDNAETANGYCEVSFAAISDTRFRIHVLSRSTAGDNNCGVASIDMYATYSVE